MDVLTTKPLPLAEWLSLLDREYLSEFVPAGGASVKFAILDDEAVDTAADQLIGLGEARGDADRAIDADRTRIHMMHELFFAITRALPWESLVQRYLEELFAAHAYAWPQPGAAMGMTDLAGAFAVAPSLLARQRDQWLTADFWADRMLAQDFRAALLRLCLSRLEPEDAATPSRCCNGCRVKGAGRAFCTPRISRPVSLASMRAPMLASLCHFVRKAGATGLLVVLDVRQLTRSSAARVRCAIRPPR